MSEEGQDVATSEVAQSPCQPYEITKKCVVGEVECQPEDVVCLNASEHKFLLEKESVESDPTTKDITRRRPESSGCGQCGASK
ncbi:MAG: hypothetical protein ACRDAM_15750 [Casimicrobium sp.]